MDAQTRRSLGLGIGIADVRKKNCTYMYSCKIT